MSKKNIFFTPVSVQIHKENIQTRSKVLTIGSCFSDHIGKLLSRYSFDCTVNPFGTIFNPVSITKALERTLNKNLITDDEIKSDGNRNFHFDYHSSFNATSPDKVAQKLNEKITVLNRKINTIDYLIITFGTSIVYKRNSNEHIVSNCHKVPSRYFTKTTLSVDDMVEKMNTCLDRLRESNNDLKIILTVSPVRHIKEGLIQNSLSKSRLVGLCHRLAERKEHVTYFPSYEIMIDELRDYRFYKRDLIHPNEFAIDIIWNRFREAYFDEDANQKTADLEALIAAYNHKPFDENSKDHNTFRLQQLEKIKHLKVKYPEVDFKCYENHFKV